MIRRAKKLVNQQERLAETQLALSASWNNARVFQKIRMADVVDTDGSGIPNDLYGYAMRAHFDFLVADAGSNPLFAIEVDGSGHRVDAAGRRNDELKNAFCRWFQIPLARVEEHLLNQPIGGRHFVTWLSETCFVRQALLEAQANYEIPYDDPCDPSHLLYHPHLKGRFPLSLATQARGKMQQLYFDQKFLALPFPAFFIGRDAQGRGTAFGMIRMGNGTLAIAYRALYLSGFGLASHEAAEELCCVTLAEAVDRHQRDGSPGVSAAEARDRLEAHIRTHDGVLFVGMRDPHLGFSFEEQRSGGGQTWTLGEVAGRPETTIEIPQFRFLSDR